MLGVCGGRFGIIEPIPVFGETAPISGAVAAAAGCEGGSMGLPSDASLGVPVGTAEVIGEPMASAGTGVAGCGATSCGSAAARFRSSSSPFNNSSSSSVSGIVIHRQALLLRQKYLS